MDDPGFCTNNTELYRNSLSTPELRRMTSSPHVHLYSHTKLNFIVQTIATIIGSLVFMLPVSLLRLFQISNDHHLAIVVLTVIFFPLVVRPFSRPRFHELAAMTAVYATVMLIIFIGNIQCTPSN